MKCPDKPQSWCGFDTIIWGHLGKIFTHTRMHTHARTCTHTHDTHTHMRTQHIEQNKICPCDDGSSLTVSRVTHPSPVKSFWQLTLKNNRNYESCIELIRNVNNVKPKTCASYSLTKLGGFNDNHETLLLKTKCFSMSTWRTPCWH